MDGHSLSIPAVAEDRSAADEVAHLRRQLETLHVALLTRDVIAQAKGMIRLLVPDIGDDDSFKLLARVSSNLNIKLHDLAAIVVANLPGQGNELPVEIRRQLALQVGHARAARTADLVSR